MQYVDPRIALLLDCIKAKFIKVSQDTHSIVISMGITGMCVVYLGLYTA